MPQPFNNAVVTDAGTELLIKAQFGEAAIEFTRIAVGDGIYMEEEKDTKILQQATGLKSMKNTFGISGITISSENSVKITALITNYNIITEEVLVTEGYYINEIGLYAREKGAEGTEILYSLAVSSGQHGDFLPGYDGYPAEIFHEYYVVTSNTAEITIQGDMKVPALADDLQAHAKDKGIHITEKERDVWDAKLDKIGDASNLSTVFTQAESRENIASGENLSTVLGKVKKWFVDLKAVAFTGSYLDLSDKLTIESELNIASENPVQNKVVTDALDNKLPKTGTAASASKWSSPRSINGMSIDGTANRTNYGICSTSASTAAKTVTCNGFGLLTGAEITVKFMYTNTASNPTLNVNSLGAKPIYYRGSAISASYLGANRTYTFRYNGAQWDFVGDINVNTDSNTWKANTASSEGYVAKGSGNANKVWKTDANGNPAWREDWSNLDYLPTVYKEDSIQMGRAEGSTIGVNSSTIGTNLDVSGNHSMAVGTDTVVAGNGCFSFGLENSITPLPNAETKGSFICGYRNVITGSSGSYSEGRDNKIQNEKKGNFVHVEGIENTIKDSNTTHLGGWGNVVQHSGISFIHAKNSTITNPLETIQTGISVFGGYHNLIRTDESQTGENNSNLHYSFVEGYGHKINNAEGMHVEGVENEIQNSYNSSYTHVEGRENVVSAKFSHVEGYRNNASGLVCHVQGYHCQANSDFASVMGRYNKETTGSFYELNDAVQNIGDAFIIGNGTNEALSNALRVTYLGDIYGTKAFQSSGADYAEFIKPWADGNPDNEDRVGYFVTVKDGFLEKAKEGDYIAGITSGNPSIVGNADEDYYWRYERDEFNRIVMEDVPELVEKKDENGDFMFEGDMEESDGIAQNPVMVESGNMVKNARMKLSEDYDPELQKDYIERKDRKEWDYVGMLGVLPVRDDGTCIPGQFCKCKEGGVASLAKERRFDTYMVLERISENVVSVILK